MSQTGSRRGAMAGVLLVSAAIVLTVVHLALDSGSGREAPGWVIYAAIACAVAGALVAGLSRSRR